MMMAVLKGIFPGVLMALGALAMLGPSAPQHVHLGGITLFISSLLIIDLQANLRFKVVASMLVFLRVLLKKDLDVSALLGWLCVLTCVFLGGGELLTMYESGITSPGLLKVGYNVINYPLGALFSFRATRLFLEKWCGSTWELTFEDSQGNAFLETIAVAPLLQQLAFFSGAVGIFSYGTLLNVGIIQFTGLMFMLCNGLNALRLIKQPLKILSLVKVQVIRE